VSRQQGLSQPLALSFVSSDLPTREAVTQRSVASALGLPHLTMTVADAVGDEPLLPAALALNRTKPGLLAAPLHPVYDALANRALEAGCAVALTGEGGDEWLLPRPEYLADRMRVLDVLEFARLARAWYGYYPIHTRRDFLWGILWKWGARRIIRAIAGSALHRRAPARLASIRTRRFCRDLPRWIFPDSSLRSELAARAIALRLEARPRDLYGQARAELLDHPNVAEFCEEAFSTRRRLGIAVRAPFLDASLIEFLAAQPPSLLVKGAEAKWLARRLVARQVAGLADDWPRTAYGDTTFQRLMQREAVRAWDGIGGTRLLNELGVVDADRLARVIRDLARNGTGADAALGAWHAMSLEIWLRARIL